MPRIADAAKGGHGERGRWGDVETGRDTDYLSGRAATPGSSMPAKNSRVAPPPVDICEILPATPADSTAFSESPPPTTESAPEFATALAIATVPLSNGGFSKTPMGPFHTIVFAVAIDCAKA